jgi:N-acyl-D-amino-acid deacylase
MARALRAAASIFLLTLPAVPRGEGAAAPFDVLIQGGTVYDGSGQAPVRADVGIRGDRIAAIGNLAAKDARLVVDAKGLAVAPGFINMLSWSNESLIADGRSQSEIRQGVTLEILGEGTSMGPLNADMKRRLRNGQVDIKYAVEWTTLAEYLAWLEKRGISTNVASFVGAATVRTHVLGLEDVQPTPSQLEQMREIVGKEMQAGALGVGTALIYPPGSYAKTEELIELCKVAARHGGMYTSHIRSEDEKIFEALDELFRISREAGIRAEIHHLKVSGRKHWGKIDRVIERIEAARAEGLAITANMYMYPASSNGLWSQIPAWAHSGGPEALFKRLGDRETRERIAKEMRKRGSMSKTIVLKFRKRENRVLIGKTLEEIAAARGTDEVDTIIDLVLEDRSRISAVLLQHERGEPREGAPPAVGRHQLRRLLHGAGGRLSRGIDPSTLVRKLRAPSRQVRPGGESDPAGRGDPPHDGTARDKPANQGPRLPAERNARGRRRLRSGDDRRYRDLRTTAAIRGRHEARLREWRAGLARR